MKREPWKSLWSFSSCRNFLKTQHLSFSLSFLFPDIIVVHGCSRAPPGIFFIAPHHYNYHDHHRWRRFLGKSGRTNCSLSFNEYTYTNTCKKEWTKGRNVHRFVRRIVCDWPFCFLAIDMRREFQYALALSSLSSIGKKKNFFQHKVNTAIVAPEAITHRVILTCTCHRVIQFLFKIMILQLFPRDNFVRREFLLNHPPHLLTIIVQTAHSQTFSFSFSQATINMSSKKLTKFSNLVRHFRHVCHPFFGKSQSIIFINWTWTQHESMRLKCKSSHGVLALLFYNTRPQNSIKNHREGLQKNLSRELSLYSQWIIGVSIHKYKKHLYTTMRGRRTQERLMTRIINWL